MSQTWVPLYQGYGYGEGSDPRFSDLPAGMQQVMDDQGNWGYWKPDAAAPSDWLHAATNPWQPQIDAANIAVSGALPSFWANALRTTSAGFDPSKGLYNIPTSYASEQEMLSNPLWWGAQDLRPEVRAAIMKDPRMAYASLHGLYGMKGVDASGLPAIPQGWESIRGRLNSENTFPIIGAEGGYRSMQDFRWLPGYGLVAPTSSYMQEQNEDYSKLAISLAMAAATSGAMSGLFAPAGAADAAIPAVGKAAWGLGQAAFNNDPWAAAGAIINGLTSGGIPGATQAAAVDDPLGAYLIDAGELDPLSEYGQSVIRGTAEAGAVVPKWAPNQAGTEFNTDMPFYPAVAEAQTMAGEGLTMAEMVELGVDPWIAFLGTSPLPTISQDTPSLGGLFKGAKSLYDLYKKFTADGGGSGEAPKRSPGAPSGPSGPSVQTDTAITYGPPVVETVPLPGISDAAGTTGPGEAVYTGPGAPPLSNTGSSKAALDALGIDSFEE